jgi:hypothetical protein
LRQREERDETPCNPNVTLNTDRFKRCAAVDDRAELPGRGGEDKVTAHDFAPLDVESAIGEPRDVARFAEAEAEPCFLVFRSLGLEHRFERHHDRDMTDRQRRVVQRTSSRPFAETRYDWDGLESPRRRFIDLDRRRRRKPDLSDDSARLELGEPLSEHIRTDPRKVRFQLGKAPRPISKLAQHQHRPSVADEVERMGKPAGIVVAPFVFRFPIVSYFF